MIFTWQFFAFINFGCALFLEVSFIVDNQSTCSYSWFREWHPLWGAGGGVFGSSRASAIGLFWGDNWGLGAVGCFCRWTPSSICSLLVLGGLGARL